MQSLLAHAERPEDIRVTVISEGVTLASKTRLQAIASGFGASLDFVEMPDLNQLAGVRLEFRQFSLATFARLWLPDLLPDANRILYIDCDTLVQDSLESLWKTELFGQNSVAGVLDAVSAANKRKVGLTPDEPYVNAGLLVIDLAKWRSSGAKETFIRYLTDHHGVVPHNDQGVMNACLRGQVLPVDPRFNVMSYCLGLTYDELLLYKKPAAYYDRAAFSAAVRRPAVLHATGSFLFDRPWFRGSRSPIAESWLAARNQTPWAEEPLWDPALSRPTKILRTLCAHPLGRRPTLGLLGVLQATMRDRLPSF